MDVLTRLRLSTRSAHERMEKLPALARLFADDYRRSELAELLTKMLNVHDPLEAVLSQTDEAERIGYRPRAPLIRESLLQLGQTPAALSRAGCFEVESPMRFTEELNPSLFNKLEGDSDIRSGRVRVDPMSSRSNGPTPVFTSPAARFGGLYVLEGSALGGQLIRRRLLSLFGETIEPALSFYAPYGDDAGPHWQNFCTILKSAITEETAMLEVEAAALATFAMFG